MTQCQLSHQSIIVCILAISSSRDGRFSCNIESQVAVYYLDLCRQSICKDIQNEYGVQL